MKIKQAAKLWMDYHRSNSQKKYDYSLSCGIDQILR